MKTAKRLFWGAVFTAVLVLAGHGVMNAIAGISGSVDHLTATCTVAAAGSGTCQAPSTTPNPNFEF